MDGIYPDISSGIISFRNPRTETEIRIKAPEDLQRGAYGIRSITMDPGAGGTILPESFVKGLDLTKSSREDKEYYVFAGVGGSSICFFSLEPIIIGVEDDKGRLARKIYPFFLVRYAPSITSEGRLLSSPEFQPHTEEVIRFISPPFRYRSCYTVEVRSPKEKFQSRRLKLEVDTGQDMDYILIGRDWQEGFDILFKKEEMIIKEH